MIGGAIWKEYSRQNSTKANQQTIKSQSNELQNLEKQRQNARNQVDSIPYDSLGNVLERELTKPNSYETNPPSHHK